ncbi:MAG TPA: roadblock/LC7 domain-containing protein [Kineosporiaceae bacterium]
MTSSVRPSIGQFNWLLAEFVRGTDGVRDAIVVSSDGLLVAKSDGLAREQADQLSAIVSGLTSLSRSTARLFGFETLRLIMIEMDRGFLLASTISNGSCIGVLAGADCDFDLIGYAVTVLVERVGDLLTPALIAESRQALEV